MTFMSIFALTVVFFLIVYFAVELGHGGGDPNHKDHNQRKRS